MCFFMSSLHAMDSYDDGLDVRVAPPRAKNGSSNGPPTAVRALTAKEWAQVEDVSTSVRAVGQVMSTEAERIAGGLPPPEPAPLAFSIERFHELRAPPSKAIAPPSGGGGKAKKANNASRRGDILRQQELKLITQDRERIAAAASCSTAPRLEAFAGRTEAFVVAALAWASGKRTCPLDAAVSLHRVEIMLESRCPNETVEVRKELHKVINDLGCRKGGLRSLIDLAIEREEVLSSPSFVAPGHLSLYPEQREVAAIVANAVKPNSSLVCLVRYVTPPSGGKSSAAALFGAVVQQARGEASRRGILGPVLVYACFSNAVRVEVSKTLIAASVPFGMMTSGVVSLSYRCYDGKPKRRKKALDDSGDGSLSERIRTSLSKAASCDRPPAVFVCDLESALGLVSLPDRNDDPLVVDEPTAGVEEEGNNTSSDERVNLCAALLAASPRCTILMSATVPDFEEMPLLVNLVKGKARRVRRTWPEGIAGQWAALANKLLEVSSSLGAPEWEDPCDDEGDDDEFLRTVSSKRLPVGLRALDATGKQWCPHHVCVDKDSLQVLIETLPNDGHLLRFYCVAALAKLIDEIDCDPQTLGLRVTDIVSHDAVRAACMRLLQENIDTLAGKTQDVPENTTLTTASVVRSAAHRFPGATLVVIDEVETFYEDAVLPLLNETKTEPIRRILRKMAAASNQEDLKNSSRKGGKRRRGGHRRRDEESYSESSDDERIDDDVAPPRKVPWPSVAVVNSIDHLSRFGPRSSSSSGNRAGKIAPDVPDEVVGSSAEALVESVLSGVALLNTRWSDQAFELAAIGLADRGSPSLVVADTSLVYGTNLPVDRALVLTAHGKLSGPEVRQFCGRAGRTGKAGRAEVVFGASWQDLADTLTVPPPPAQRRRSQLDRAIARAFRE